MTIASVMSKVKRVLSAGSERACLSDKAEPKCQGAVLLQLTINTREKWFGFVSPSSVSNPWVDKSTNRRELGSSVTNRRHQWCARCQESTFDRHRPFCRISVTTGLCKQSAQALKLDEAKPQSFGKVDSCMQNRRPTPRFLI